MAQKHYHNDYKKLIGFDESRTASEKLLDKAIGRKLETKVIIKQVGEEPRKKVKIQGQQKQKIAAEDALTKILKIISNRQNIIKMQKSLEVLKKCLNEADFLNTLKQQRIRQIVGCLINNCKFPSGSLGQFAKLIENQTSILEILSDLLGTESKQNALLKQKIQIQTIVLSLISDDNFSFNRNIGTLKSKIFNQFQAYQSAQKSQKSNESENEMNNQKVDSVKLFIQNYILNKLMNLPHINYEWVHTGVVNFLKQFIIYHKQKLSRKKQFLSEYNKFIQSKKIGIENSTSDILGQKRAASTGSYTVIEKHDSDNTWCKKQ